MYKCQSLCNRHSYQMQLRFQSKQQLLQLHSIKYLNCRLNLKLKYKQQVLSSLWCMNKYSSQLLRVHNWEQIKRIPMGDIHNWWYLQLMKQELISLIEQPSHNTYFQARHQILYYRKYLFMQISNWLAKQLTKLCFIELRLLQVKENVISCLETS